MNNNLIIKTPILFQELYNEIYEEYLKLCRSPSISSHQTQKKIKDIKKDLDFLTKKLKKKKIFIKKNKKISRFSHKKMVIKK